MSSLPVFDNAFDRNSPVIPWQPKFRLQHSGYMANSSGSKESYDTVLVHSSTIKAPFAHLDDPHAVVRRGPYVGDVQLSRICGLVTTSPFGRVGQLVLLRRGPIQERKQRLLLEELAQSPMGQGNDFQAFEQQVREAGSVCSVQLYLAAYRYALFSYDVMSSDQNIEEYKKLGEKVKKSILADQQRAS